MDPEDHEDSDSMTCEECGYTGTDFLEEENPEHLWGVVGQVSDVCPECGAHQLGW